MADVVLASLIDATLSHVISAASELIKLAGGGGKKDLERLQGKLDQIRDVLSDADKKQHRNKAVRRWLEKLEKEARESEDVLDELVYERLKHKVEIRGQRKKKVRLFFTHSNPSIFRLRMANKIKNLITSIDDINKEAREYDLQSRLDVSAPESRSNPQTAHPFLGYCSQVMGRDDDISKLVDLLIDPSNKQPLSVISVVGMGGLGKTTLVRSVEKEEKVREHFGKIMSVCVSEDFDVKRILKDMLECLSKESCSIGSESAIMEKIKEKLGDKNYLLFLDDVWNENELMKWEELRGCLLEINKNNVSRVVVTTRSKKVALTMGTPEKHVHQLEGLQDDECWSIIKQRVFGDSLVPDQELEQIGRQIAEKCRGVPLVASIIGASLSTRIDRHEWLSVQNSDAWDSLKDDSTGRGILGVLQSSFDRLPDPALKNCFAFCSIFPKDYVYERNSLVQLWMAGGLLQPSERNSVAILEDIGDKYFDDLLSYALFQTEKRDSYGKITHCKMHDLIHDLAMSNSKSETLILKAASRGNIAHVRHLNLNLVDDMEHVPTNFEEVAGKLRALFLNGGILCKLPECFKRLRIFVVHVQYKFDGHCIEQLPTWIGKMKHLRYLDISNTRIKELPQFIMKLYSLQTLRFEYCHLIEKQPQGVENLVNLKHIHFSYEKCAPVGIGRLADLQTLPFFVVGRQKGSQIEDLGSLSQLRGCLNICGLEFVENYIEAKKAKLCEKMRLHELVLKWGIRFGGECKHDEDVLEGLQPPSSVQRLTIDNYGGEKCPTWMDCPLSGLFTLYIESCHMLKSIPTMRGFSALQELHVKSCHELTGMGDDVSALPTSLRILKIMCCPSLQTIEHGLSSLTCLEELEIGGCGNLRTIPIIDGLSSLKKLTIKRCDGLVSVSLPTNLHSLIELNIFHCKSLRSIPDESLGYLVSLQKLRIGGFSEELEEFPGLSSIQCLNASLQTLKLIGWETLKCLPPQIQHLTSLRYLFISEFNQVEALPKWLGSLSSLRSLSIRGCNNLKHPPNSTEVMQYLSKLPFLEIDGSPELSYGSAPLSPLREELKECIEEKDFLRVEFRQLESQQLQQEQQLQNQQLQHQLESQQLQQLQQLESQQLQLVESQQLQQ